MNEEKIILDTAEETARIIFELSDARIKRGISQRKLAEMCGLKQSAIARMESVQSIPRLDTIVRVAKCLGVKIAFVADRPEANVTNAIITVNPYHMQKANNTNTYGVYSYASAD